MTIVFILAAVYCSFLGLLIWFFPDTLIKINDWLTEKTLLREKKAIVYRIVLGAAFLGISGIFWWVIFS